MSILDNNGKPRETRQQMATETGEWLSRHLPKSDWRRKGEYTADDSKHDPERRPNGSPRQDRAGRPARQSPAVGTLIEVSGNDHGHVDHDELRRLADSLTRLAGEHQRGDVMLDLGHVRSITPKFITVICTFDRQLHAQGRSVVLVGVGPSRNHPLSVSELRRLTTSIER